jgi:tripartite ATP-independent transporter DctM subunit
LSRIIDGLRLGGEVAITVALLVELVVMFSGTVSRTFFSYSLIWSQDLAQFCIVVLTFAGGAIAYERNLFPSAQLLVTWFRYGWLEAWVNKASDWLVLWVAVTVGWLAASRVDTGWETLSPILRLPTALTSIVMVLGMALMALFALRRLLASQWRVAAWSGIALAALGAAALFLLPLISQSAAYVPILVFLFVGLVVLGMSIPAIFAALALAYLATFGDSFPLQIVFSMRSGIDNILLLAVPLFVLAAEVMTDGGMTRPLASFVAALAAPLRAGLLQVIVIMMYVFSGISGSKIADVVGVGGVVRDMARHDNYKPEQVAAVLAASAVMGETIPPSVGLLILGSITSLSISSLFLAGFLPAIAVALCLVVGIYLLARARAEHAGHGFAPRTVARLFPAAGPALVTPIVLVAGIVGGVGTPTEVSSVAVIWGLVTALLIYRSLELRSFMRLLQSAAAMGGMVFFVVSTASAFSWVVTATNLPQELVLLFNVLHEPWVFLLVSAGLMVVMGAMLEGIGAILIFPPLLLPAAVALGISPIHYGIVMILAMGAGFFSPPLGVGFYISASVAGARPQVVMRESIIYTAIVMVGLILVTLVPAFSLALPRLFHLST